MPTQFTTARHPAHSASDNWDARKAELEALYGELIAAGHDPRHAGRFASELLDELLDWAAAWDADALSAHADAVATPQPVAEMPQAAALRRAADKAAYHLAGGLEIRTVGRAYLVPSGTRGGVIHRVVDGQCSCEAGQAHKPCWHTAAVDQAAAMLAAA